MAVEKQVLKKVLITASIKFAAYINDNLKPKRRLILKRKMRTIPLKKSKPTIIFLLLTRSDKDPAMGLKITLGKVPTRMLRAKLDPDPVTFKMYKDTA